MGDVNFSLLTVSQSLLPTENPKGHQATKSNKAGKTKQPCALFLHWLNTCKATGKAPSVERKAIIWLKCLRLCMIMWCCYIPARALACTVHLFIHTAALFSTDAVQCKHRNMSQNTRLFSKYLQPFQSGFGCAVAINKTKKRKVKKKKKRGNEWKGQQGSKPPFCLSRCSSFE